MIQNVFEDNGKVILDVKNNLLFSYVFSSDAHVIAKDLQNYNYAGEISSWRLKHYLENKKETNSRFLFLGPVPIDFEKINKNTVLKCDRDRTVNYNGNETDVNTYTCNSCREEVITDTQPHYCLKCGVKFKTMCDVSV